MAWDRRKIVARIRDAATRFPSRDSVNPQQYRQLNRALRSIGADEAYAALREILVTSSPDSYGEQEYAGRLLLDISPPCRGDPIDTVSEILPRYNLSVEQIPWYFAGALGRDDLLCVLGDLDDTLADAHAIRACRTWQWWLKKDPKTLFGSWTQ